ncbi:hypothetical protein Aperf_G00000022268 [Anoplocephala perfoliata]
MFFVCSFFVLCLLQLSVLKADNRLLKINTAEKYLNICLESDELNEHPTPEPSLEGCSQWKESSCCTDKTANQIINESLNGFTFKFCNNSDATDCKKFFLREHCMFKCSPHLGPWIVKTTSSTFKETVFGVPLCESDCNEWYNACKDFKACATNWRSGGFDWSAGTNACREGYECIAISKIYGSAKTFCESVWDNSYSVTSSDSVQEWIVTDYHCMHIPRGENDLEDKKIIEHNKEVAKRQAEAIIKRVYG